MQQKTVILAIVAVLAILGSVARLVITRSPSAPRANLKPFEQLGVAAAEETVKLLKNLGTVVVILETLDGVISSSAEAQIKGFKATLAKHSGLTLKEVKEFQRDSSSDLGVWPAGQAGKFASLGSGANALVLFANLPQSLGPEDLAALKESKAKFLVVGTKSPLLDSLMAEGVIPVAIVGRTPPKPAPTNPETPQQWFDRVYTVLKSP